MEEALNAYLEEQGENVRIDLDPIDGNNYMTQVDMALMGGEKNRYLSSAGWTWKSCKVPIR